jgi:GDPmannose 4,6-dehydratase
LKLHYGDLADGTCLRRIVEDVKPHEVYNLAAQSHVRVSFLEPEYTADVTGVGALRLFDVIRDVEAKLGWKVKVYQAGSSEM